MQPASSMMLLQLLSLDSRAVRVLQSNPRARPMSQGTQRVARGEKE